MTLRILRIKRNMFEEVIKHYPDFPKPGIDFIDVLPFLHDKQAFKAAVETIDQMCTTPNVATVEARGFLFAAPLLSVSDHVQTLVAIRKKGKLPHAEDDMRRVEIEKEYGSDEVFYRRSDLAACTQKDGVIELTLFDDLLATGGTAAGIARALESEAIAGLPVKIKEFVFLVELADLKGRDLLESIAPVRSLMCLEGTE